MASSGFQHYYNLLALDSSSYLIHYDFNESGNVIPSTQGANPSGSGVLVGGIGGFFGVSGSGAFTNQSVQISNASGMPSDSWTHFFIYQRTGSTGGILFSSMNGTNPSGYTIGVTDNNRLYFENYPNGAPQILISSMMYGEKNAVAVSRSRNLLSFYYYDFNINTAVGEGFSIAPYVEAYQQASIGAGQSLPSYIPNSQFKGYIDEYVYISEAFDSSTINILFSGFYSEYIDYPLTTGTSGYYTVTGYDYLFTGITGVTGYSTTQVQSGTDIFGDPVFVYTTTPLTGYVLSGQITVPLSGYISYPITGAQSGYLLVDSNFGNNGFGMNCITYLQPVPTGVSYLNLFSNYTSGLINLQASFDRISELFELQSRYSGQLGLFANGLAQAENLNYTVSGFEIEGSYSGYNEIMYDALVINNEYVPITYVISGWSEAISVPSPNNKLFFFNGSLLIQGIDYQSSGGVFSWIVSRSYPVYTALETEGGFTLVTESFCGPEIDIELSPLNPVTGILLAYTIPTDSQNWTGQTFTSLPYFQRNTSQLFSSGYRQEIGATYLENSAIDLLKGSGLFETNLAAVYNDEGTYWE